MTLSINIVGNSAVEGSALASAPTKLTFTISLSEALTSPLTLNYSTSNGTATSGKDYTAVTNKLITFAAGQTVTTIEVDILNDDISEVDKNFFVNVFIPKSTPVFNTSTTDLLAATVAGTITDTLSASTTTVLAESSTTNKNTIENLTLTGTADIDGTGNKLNNVLTGNSGANILDGADGQDTLDGKGGADILKGGNGNDTYIVADNADTITETSVVGAGIDTVQASANYTLGTNTNLENLILAGTATTGTGNELGNFLTGNNSNNSLSGLDGNDTLQGNGGTDTLIGGLGDDTYIIVDVSDTITEAANAGTDTIRASIDYILTVSNVENVELVGIEDLDATGDTGANKLTGNRGDNTLTGDVGNDTLEGGSGVDTLIGGLGNDVYVVSNAEDVNDVTTEAANSDIDQVDSAFSYTLQTNLEKLLLTGTESINGTGNNSDNTLTGNSGDNVLDGSAGNDTLDGGLGNDSMSGGLGNDTYIVESATDVVVETANQGTDTVQSSITYTLGSNVENLLLTGTGIITGTGNTLNNSLIGNQSNNTLNGDAGNDTLNGGAGNDSLDGGANNDTLNGDAGNDTLNGDAGNDSLDGGLGADILNGGAGNDIYVVDILGEATETSTLVTEIDLVKSSVSYTLGNNLENLELMGTDALTGTGNTLNNKITGNSGNDNLVGLAGNDSLDGGLGADILNGGDANDTLKGGDGNDSLDGGLGNDSLDGGLGADILNGGDGNDIYVVDNFQDVVNSDTLGTDTVQSSISHSLVSGLEHLTLTGAGSINGTGNELANTILGNSSSNTIDGKDGTDSIDGGSGNDVLKGGAGNDTLKGNSSSDFDTLIGGIGNDDYYVDTTEDVIIEKSNEGADKVFSTATTYTLSEDVEQLTLSGTANINGAGNSSNNTITGNAGSNFIDGGAGDDIMIGGAGNDIYVIDSTADAITETSTLTTEIDIAFSSANYTLINNVNVEKLILTGTADLTGTGNSSNNRLMGNDGNNILTGNEGNDILDGSLGNDSLVGGAGNDILDGSLGNDSLVGGAGDDVYFIDSSSDTVTEVSSGGLLDTAKSYISNTVALATNVENLVLLGTDNLTGTGNTLANRITGNSGNNDLRGGRGNDTLIGGSGADQFSYSSGNTDFGSDHIVDFNRSQGDKIALGKTTFNLTSNTGNGFSNASDFAIVATDDDAIISSSSATIVYNSTSGEIFYNANGATLGGESIVTTLDVNSNFALTSLSASDFTII